MFVLHFRPFYGTVASQLMIVNFHEVQNLRRYVECEDECDASTVLSWTVLYY